MFVYIFVVKKLCDFEKKISMIFRAQTLHSFLRVRNAILVQPWVDKYSQPALSNSDGHIVIHIKTLAVCLSHKLYLLLNGMSYLAGYNDLFQKHFRTKNSRVKWWWNWLLVEE